MHSASEQHQNHPRQRLTIAVSQTPTPDPSQLAPGRPPGAGPTRCLTTAKLTQLREQVKQDVIAHYRENKAQYPTFIRQRRDLIIGRVMNGSTVEEAFAAEAGRRH